jgi:hypothetical protein
MGACGLARQTQSFPDAGHCTRGPILLPGGSETIPFFEESSRRSCLAAPHRGGGAGRDPSESYELSFLVRLAGREASRALNPRDAAPRKTGRRRKTVALFSKTVPRTPTM